MRVIKPLKQHLPHLPTHFHSKRKGKAKGKKSGKTDGQVWTHTYIFSLFIALIDGAAAAAFKAAHLMSAKREEKSKPKLAYKVTLGKKRERQSL